MRFTASILPVFLGMLLALPAWARKPDGQLELAIVDAKTLQPLPTRIHLRDSRGRSVRTRRWGLAPLGNHAYIDGTATLGLKRGTYRFDLDAGPEYRTRQGHFEIVRHADDTERIEFERFANLAEEGWLGADLQSARPAKDLPLLKRAAQLSLASQVAYEWRDHQWQTVGRHTQATEADALWSEPRGTVWFVDPTGELSADDLPQPERSMSATLLAAQDAGWLVLANITSMELPVWLAHDAVDGVLLIDGWSDSPAGKLAKGYDGDAIRYAGRRGAGRWREYVYHQMLEVGLRVPPVAGSGSGLNKQPLGKGTVYVHAGPSLRAYPEVSSGRERPKHPMVGGRAVNDTHVWWERLAEGAVVVTNGPLLRPMIEGEPPGATFSVETGFSISLEIGLSLATRDAVDYLEVLQNGRAVQSVRLADWAKAGGRLPPVEFNESGWLLIRAVTNATDCYQLALTAPYWVESPEGPRVSPQAVQFFTVWLEKAAKKFGNEDPTAYETARQFWKAK